MFISSLTISNSYKKELLSLRNSYLLSLVFICVFYSDMVAQNPTIDSLLKVLQTHSEDTNRVNLLTDISWRYSELDIEKTLSYGGEALVLSEKLNYQEGIGLASNLIALTYSANGDQEKAIELNVKSLEIGRAIKDDFLIGRSSNDLGIIYSNQGNYTEALVFYQNAHDAAKRLDDKLGKFYTLNNIGSLHESMGNVEESIKYKLASAEMGLQSGNPLIIANAHISIASLARKEKDWEKAESNYKKVYDYAKVIEDKAMISSSLFALGKIVFEKGDKIGATKYGERSMAVIVDHGDLSFKMYQLLKIAILLQKTGELKKAILYGNESLTLSIEHGNKEVELECYKLLASIYIQEKKYKKAFEFKKTFSSLSDSLFSNEKHRRVIELEEKYESQKKEVENKLLLVQQKEQIATIRRQRKMGFLLSVIALLMTISGIVSYWVYLGKAKSHKLLEQKVSARKKELQKSNENLRRSNDELEKFAYIASHDLKEPLRNIGSFTGLLNRELKIEKGSAAFDYMSFVFENTERMYGLIEELLVYSQVIKVEKEKEYVDLNSCIIEVRSLLSNLIKNKTAEIQVINALPIIEGQFSQICLLFKNIIENGIKYNENTRPKITIDYTTVNNFYHITITDNGIGINPEYHQQIFEMFKRLHSRQEYKGTGLGLPMCEKIVNHLGGEIGVKNEEGKGSEFYFTLPKCDDGI